MLNLIFLVSCLSGLISGIKITKNHTQPLTFKHDKLQEVHMQSVFLNKSQNNHLYGHPTLNLLEGKKTTVIFNATQRDLFVCPAGQTYLSYKDALYNDVACSLNLSSNTYRLQSGGSVVPGDTEDCKKHSSDNRDLQWTACVSTSIKNVTKTLSANCSEGFDLINFEEVNKDLSTYCNLLGEWEIVRIGYKGSISGSGHECKVKEWDEDDLNTALCVQRSLNEIKIVATNETICPKKRTLLTVEEAIADLDKYCSLIPYWGIARLAGGASMAGEGYMCRITEIDRSSLGHALCGRSARPQLDQPNKKKKNDEFDYDDDDEEDLL